MYIQYSKDAQERYGTPTASRFWAPGRGGGSLPLDLICHASVKRAGSSRATAY